MDVMYPHGYWLDQRGYGLNGRSICKSSHEKMSLRAVFFAI
ncbi:uncharacterized protein METZ01_LOCUS361071 [marine metagenome]|uniref:Uncharacterized protein n=1 Tax=marine metagenome TaxID=408172 RepID=A0A382SG86_9ZZZZ